MPRDPAAGDAGTLLDIRIAAERVSLFVRGIDGEGFLRDLKTQSAVLHQLLILGEATKRLSIGLRANHPGIPWHRMAGMRDHLIHGYDDVDLEAVWKTATVDIPALIADLEPLLPPERP